MDYPYVKVLKANQEAVEGYLKDMEITKFFDDTPFNKDEVTKPFKLPENPCHDCELTLVDQFKERKHLFLFEDMKKSSGARYSPFLNKEYEGKEDNVKRTIYLKYYVIFGSFWAGELLLQDSITVELKKGSGRTAFSMEKTFHFTIRGTKKNGELYTQEEHKNYLESKKNRRGFGIQRTI
jgi:hypothetical protein